MEKYIVAVLDYTYNEVDIFSCVGCDDIETKIEERGHNLSNCEWMSHEKNIKITIDLPCV